MFFESPECALRRYLLSEESQSDHNNLTTVSQKSGTKIARNRRYLVRPQRSYGITARYLPSFLSRYPDSAGLVPDMLALASLPVAASCASGSLK